MEEFVQKNIMPPVMKLVNTKAIQAMKDGMIYTIPLIIAGSIFLILGQLPVQSWADAVSSVQIGDMTLTDLFLKANGSSFSINAIIAVVAIAYMYVKNEGYEPLGGAFVALASFLMISPASVTGATESGEELVIGNVIDKGWTGGKAMIGSKRHPEKGHPDQDARRRSGRRGKRIHGTAPGNLHPDRHDDHRGHFPCSRKADRYGADLHGDRCSAAESGGLLSGNPALLVPGSLPVVLRCPRRDPDFGYHDAYVDGKLHGESGDLRGQRRSDKGTGRTYRYPAVL